MSASPVHVFVHHSHSQRRRPRNQRADACRQGHPGRGRQDRNGFDFLLKTAQRESNLDPTAKAPTSSATGLFQFVEQTWLGMVKEGGARHGLQAYADAIKETDSGRFAVADPKLREDILNLRRDPRLAAVMAGELTQKNRESLTGALGREPKSGELYMAHVLGARGAGDLIKGAASSPNGAAASAFPDAAAANRGIFFDKSGKARSFSEVYAILGAAHANVAVTGQPAGTGETSAAPMPGLAPGRAKGLVGMFSTDAPRGPVSDAVTRLWVTPRNGARVAMLDNGPRYFPRDSAAASAAPAIASDASPKPVVPLVSAPLPPARPDAVSAASAAPAAVVRSGRRGPLDLSRFMAWKGGA